MGFVGQVACFVVNLASLALVITSQVLPDLFHQTTTVVAAVLDGTFKLGFWKMCLDLDAPGVAGGLDFNLGCVPYMTSASLDGTVGAVCATTYSLESLPVLSLIFGSNLLQFDVIKKCLEFKVAQALSAVTASLIGLCFVFLIPTMLGKLSKKTAMWSAIIAGLSGLVTTALIVDIYKTDGDLTSGVTAVNIGPTFGVFVAAWILQTGIALYLVISKE